MNVTASGSPAATIDIATVKTGFLRKSRVYTVEIEEGLQPHLRPLVLGLAVRYDAVLNAVKAAAAD